MSSYPSPIKTRNGTKSPYRHISIGLVLNSLVKDRTTDYLFNLPSFAAHDVRLSRLPGWEPKSWGYHGDDGNSFAADKTGTSYGPTFGSEPTLLVFSSCLRSRLIAVLAGDIIGCGMDFSTNKAFFTKNGTFIGKISFTVQNKGP